MANLKKNIIYQTAYEVLNVCLPLITSPYLSRVLGATQLGVFSYASSIVNYFVLFAMLGITSYGARTIASLRNDQKSVDGVYSEIYTIQLCTTGISVVLYAILLVFTKTNRIIMAIQGIELLSKFFQNGWLFTAYEKMQKVVRVNAVLRVLAVCLILLLVKTPQDLWLYVLIMASSHMLGALLLWSASGRLARYRLPSFSSIGQHLKPIMTLFVPLLAMSFYHLMDKAMLGWISTYEQSGFYYNADKVINIPVGMLTGVGTVLLPRISLLLGNGQKKEADRLFFSSLEGIAVAACAVSVGIASVAKEFTPVFFGQGYDECVGLIILLSPVLIIKAFSLTARNAYLIPNKADQCYIASVIAGAAVNLVANMIFIPRLGAMGAVIGTLLAELVACLWQYRFINRQLKCSKLLLKSAVYFLFSIIMFLAVRLVADLFASVTVLSLIVEIAVGGAVYVLICVLYWKATSNPIMETFFSNFFRRHAKENAK